jgi:multisubunit Na+/H+ antiporter MnhE subunit
VSRVVEALGWWAVLTAGYLGVISKISWTELLVGGCAAAVGTAAAMAARRLLASEEERQGPYRPGFAALAGLPLEIVGDTARVLWSPAGSWGETQVSANAAGKGGLALLMSASPGTFVGKIDPDRGRLVVHRTRGRTSPLEKRLTGES